MKLRWLTIAAIACVPFSGCNCEDDYDSGWELVEDWEFEDAGLGAVDADVGDSPVVANSGCGDGQIEGREQCDDHNTDDGDGCSERCTIEPRWDCTNALNLNTGSDGRGGQLSAGSADPVWTWVEGTLNPDGTTPTTLPAGLPWKPTTVIGECASTWHDATPPAQWINSTGWDAAAGACVDHPQPLDESLRYYRATFTIATDNAASATTLSGQMWADNQATRIFINGAEVTEYVPPAADGSSYETADAVSFGSWGSRYYRAGQNEIVIAVKNLAATRPPNPEGLLVRVPDAGSVCTRN